MSAFANLRELLLALSREEKLLTAMFQKRKSIDYEYRFALEVVGYDDRRIQYLIDRELLRQNGNHLEIDDRFLHFFEQVLETNEEINISYINENLEKIRQNIGYYFNETNESRKYDYLRVVKNTLRAIGVSTLRNVVDLKRNLDHTFKTEPNYKNKQARLEHLDKKRTDIVRLIESTERLIGEDDITFFKTATDEELHTIIVQLKIQLGKCSHNLIEIQKQVIDYLNQIKQQSTIVERLRKLKYLKDQYLLESATDIQSVLAGNDALVFEPRPSYPLKLSLEWLQSSEEALESIRKSAAKQSVRAKPQLQLAERISEDYLQTQIEEEIQINLEEVKSGFLAGSNNLFDFVMSYQFAKEVEPAERVTVFCQLVSQYDHLFYITDRYDRKSEVEVALIYPKENDEPTPANS